MIKRLAVLLIAIVTMAAIGYVATPVRAQTPTATPAGSQCNGVLTDTFYLSEYIGVSDPNYESVEQPSYWLSAPDGVPDSGDDLMRYVYPQYDGQRCSYWSLPMAVTGTLDIEAILPVYSDYKSGMYTFPGLPETLPIDARNINNVVELNQWSWIAGDVNTGFPVQYLALCTWGTSGGGTHSWASIDALRVQSSVEQSCGSTATPTPTPTATETPTVTPTATATRECLQPTNGEFTTDANWEWTRGATWSGSAAQLPANGNGLINSNPQFAFPTVAAGQYLILAWDAIAAGNGGYLGSRAVAGANDATGYYQTYPSAYLYQADISPLAGQDYGSLAFVNAATGTLTADLTVDNVCVYVSDTAPTTPQPLNPGAFNPVDLGGNITSCADVDAIWAGLGVNMAKYRADYAAGFSFWEPTEWLVAAIFTTLADWSCFFMLAYASLINAIEYILNSILNVYSWFAIFGKGIVSWVNLFARFALQSIENAFNLIAEFLRALMPWIESSISNTMSTVRFFAELVFRYIGDSLTNIMTFVRETVTNYWQWLTDSLTEIISWLNSTFGEMMRSFGAMLGHIIRVLSDVTEAIWRWLFESFTNVFSWLGDTFVAMLSYVKDLMAWLIDFIGGTLANLFGWIGDVVMAFWNALTGSLGNWFGWIRDNAETFWQWLTDTLFNANGLRSLLNLLIAVWNALVDTIGAILSYWFELWAWFWNDIIFPLLQAIWNSFTGIFGRLGPGIFGIVEAIYNLALAIGQWLYTNVIQLTSIPFQLWTGFRSGLDSPAFDDVFICTGDTGFWCFIFAGLSLINQAVSPSVMYPLVIVCIIVATIVVFYQQLEDIGGFILETLRNL